MTEDEQARQAAYSEYHASMRKPFKSPEQKLMLSRMSRDDMQQLCDWLLHHEASIACPGNWDDYAMLAGVFVAIHERAPVA